MFDIKELAELKKMVVGFVSKQASEWIGGVKRFLSFPYGPEARPIDDYQLVNKHWTIESDTCEKLVVSTSAHTSTTNPDIKINDIWVDMTRTPSVVSTTTDYTILSTDLLALVNNTTGSCSVVLGSAQVHAYRDYWVKKISNNDYAVRINPDGTQTIDGNILGYLIAENESLQIASDGRNWQELNPYVESYKTPTSISLVYGTITAAFSAADTNNVGFVNGLLDGSVYEVRETATTPGIRVSIRWSDSGIAGPIKKFNSIFIRGYYKGSSSHTVQIQIYNYYTTSFDTLQTMRYAANLDEWEQFNIYVPIEDTLPNITYSFNGIVVVRLEHTVGGNSSHYFFLDYIALAYRN